MTSRYSFVGSSALFASLLAFASACSDTVVVPTDTGAGGNGGDGNGGDAGDGGDGTGPNGPGTDGDCPSNVRTQNICTPDVPVTSVEADCNFGVADNQCKPAAPKPGTLADCPTGITDGLCDAAAPAFTNWACPGGSGAVPGLRFSDGSSLAVEGVSNFTSCQAVWADSCATDTKPRFGNATCQNVSGRACPGANDWPLDEVIRASAGFPANAVIHYVVPGSAAVGDGLLRTTPSTLAAALVSGVATDGDIIALAQGDYTSDQIALDRGIALVGACASQTQITALSQDEGNALVRLSASGAHVAELTLTGNRPGVSVDSGGTHIDNLQILSALKAGVSVTAGDTSLTNVSITGTRTNAAGAGGPGLSVVTGGAATLADVSLVGNAGAAISVSGASSNVVGTDVIVTDTVAATSGGPGQGAVVATGGNLDLTRAVFARNRSAGVLVQDAGSSASLVDTFITGTVATATALSGAAVYAFGGSQLIAQRLLATGNVLGVRVAGADTTLDLQDSIIADPSAASGVGVLGEGGPGISARRVALLRNQSGLVLTAGTLLLDSVVIAGSTGPALSTAGSESQVTQLTLADNGGGASFTGGGKLDLSDTRVVDTRQVGGAEAHAVLIENATGTVERVVLARNAEYGMYVSGERANLDFSDLRVTDTRSVQEAGKAVRGIGLIITDPAGAPNIGVTRAIISQSHAYGVLVNGPGVQVALTDASVIETQAVDAPARAGGIVFVNQAPATQASGGLLTLTRVKVDDNADTGASVSGPGIELDLSDVSVSNTRPLTTGQAGGGLAVQGGAILSGVRVQVANNAHTGVVVEGTGTELDLGDLVVSDTQPSSASGPSGEGLKVVGGIATIQNGSFLRNVAAGVWAAQGADVDLSDVVLDETQAPSGGSGVGIDVIGAKLTGKRLTLSKSHGLGLSASLGAQVTIQDVSISGTQAAAIAGRGVEVSSGSTVELNRVTISGTPDYAVLAAGPDAQTPGLLAQFPQGAALPAQTSLALYDLAVHDVAGGLAALPGAALDLDTFDIRSSQVVGLQLVEGATLTAVGGNITANPVGVNVQGGTSIDLTKAFDNVVVTGNKVDRGTQALPVPVLSDVLSRSGAGLEPQTIQSP